jgi:hypothetical protein
MFAKKIIYVLLFVVGVSLLGLGLLFLMGSGGSSSRSMTGFVMIGIGVASLIGGSGMKASVKKNMPSMIDVDMMRLASRSDGRVTADMAVADLHITKAQALESLDRLSSAGTARPDMTDNGVAHIFDQVKPKRKIRKCSYCGAQYPVSKPITKCENCGGEVKLVEQ